MLSPSKATYLDLVVDSDKTPVPASKMAALLDALSAALWGEENLKGDSEGTSAENETSIVQWADVCGKKVLLTGDAGVRALTEAHEAAETLGKSTAGVDWFQVPHHGSRRNLSSDVLDTWLGKKLVGPPDAASSSGGHFGESKRQGAPQEGRGTSPHAPGTTESSKRRAPCACPRMERLHEQVGRRQHPWSIRRTRKTDGRRHAETMRPSRAFRDRP